MAPKKGTAQQQRKSENYTNIYFYDFGRRGAWARDPRVGGARLFIGTHMTERVAARCQDRALLKMEMEPWSTKEIKLNFKREDCKDDQDLRNSTTTADFLERLSGKSLGKYNKLQPTACLLKFLAEEESLGVIAPEMPLEGPRKVIKPETRVEGPLGVLAQESPVSCCMRCKRPMSTTKEQSKEQYKKPKIKREWDSSNQEFDHYPSEPEVYAPLPLEFVIPIAPLPLWTGGRLKSGATEWRARPLAVVAPVTLAVANRVGNRRRTRVIRAISRVKEEAEDQKEASEALLTTLAMMPSREEEDASDALVTTLALMPSREEEDASDALVTLLSSGRGSARSGVSWTFFKAIFKNEEGAAEALLML